MILEHKEIICTNKECQAAFEKLIDKEQEKRAKLAQVKLENEAKRAQEKAAHAASLQQ